MGRLSTKALTGQSPLLLLHPVEFAPVFVSRDGSQHIHTPALRKMGRRRASPLRVRPGCRADWKMHLGAILPSEEEGKASVSLSGEASLSRDRGEEAFWLRRRSELTFTGPGFPADHGSCSWASLLAQLVKNPPIMQETGDWSLDWKDPLEKGKSIHSSILA